MYSYCYYKKEAKQKSTIMGAHCVAVYTEDLTEDANAVVDPYSKEESLSPGHVFSILIEDQKTGNGG